LQKAKSRLKQLNLENNTITDDIKTDFPVGDFPDRKKSSSASLVMHLKHLPTLILSLFFYFLLFIVFVNFDPSSLKNIVLQNSYFPVLVLFFFSNFFLFSFIFLNSFKGFIYSLYFLLIFFLKIQHVVFDFILIISLIGFMLIFELSWKLGIKLFKNN